MSTPAVLALLTVTALTWRALYVHRLKVCPKCKGAGVVHHWFFVWRFYPCPRCERKREVRGTFGARQG
jgi:hypothetical protein